MDKNSCQPLYLGFVCLEKGYRVNGFFALWYVYLFQLFVSFGLTDVFLKNSFCYEETIRGGSRTEVDVRHVDALEFVFLGYVNNSVSFRILFLSDG